jgi:hypothetical protein
LRLERWIFIYSPTTATLQNHQTQALANQARSEIVYVKFASEEQLLRQIRDKLKEFLPEKVTEYIELTKKRAQEFLVDYRKSFLEPLLQQILLIRRQLQKDSDLSYSDYWSPENVRNSPYFYIDESLQNELENFFSSFQKCQLLTAEARRAYGENCKQIVEFHINSYIDRLDSDAKGRASQNIEQSLHQTCLMNVINPDKLSNEERERIRMQLGRVISSELDKPYIQASDRWAYIITQIIDGLIKLNQLGNTIRNYLEARKQVETAASNAYETLWKRFLESAGVDRIGG